jgi:hypothetical protein
LLSSACVIFAAQQAARTDIVSRSDRRIVIVSHSHHEDASHYRY